MPDACTWRPRPRCAPSSRATRPVFAPLIGQRALVRCRFARTISVAVSCSQFAEYYLLKVLLPILTPLTASDFVHWLPTVLTGATKAVFVYLAWKAQAVVSAVQSALRGGLMFSRGLLSHLNKRGVKSVFGFSLQDEHTYVDEIFGYTVALFGVWVQVLSTGSNRRPPPLPARLSPCAAADDADGCLWFACSPSVPVGLRRTVPSESRHVALRHPRVVHPMVGHLGHGAAAVNTPGHLGRECVLSVRKGTAMHIVCARWAHEEGPYRGGVCVHGGHMGKGRPVCARP